MPRTLFWFEIPIGADWHHELPVARDENGNPVDDWTGWVATMQIRDQDDNAIVSLASTVFGADGSITLSAGGTVDLDLDAAVTATLTPTATYAGGKTRARLFGDLMLTKGTTSILAARMSGVATTTTAIGA